MRNSKVKDVGAPCVSVIKQIEACCSTLSKSQLNRKLPFAVIYTHKMYSHYTITRVTKVQWLQLLCNIHAFKILLWPLNLGGLVLAQPEGKKSQMLAHSSI